MREYINLECTKCGNRNYRTSKQTGGGAPKLKIKKYCRFCRAHTVHNEKKK
ncbi:MAG: 50S ribosomal protein L33 [Planctomycetota bacterium]|nr:MAG: 50S ribosomal protein L33 [Planctomycetota bacterium]